jgi:hypothetical protein
MWAYVPVSLLLCSSLRRPFTFLDQKAEQARQSRALGHLRLRVLPLDNGRHWQYRIVCTNSASTALQAIIQRLKGDYELILIDSPSGKVTTAYVEHVRCSSQNRFHYFQYHPILSLFIYAVPLLQVWNPQKYKQAARNAMDLTDHEAPVFIWFHLSGHQKHVDEALESVSCTHVVHVRLVALGSVTTDMNPTPTLSFDSLTLGSFTPFDHDNYPNLNPQHFTDNITLMVREPYGFEKFCVEKETDSMSPCT